jgi:hypothetical protein
LESSGQLASAAATTTLGGMVKNVNSSRAKVQDLSPAAQESRDAREASLDVLNGCVAGILKAQEAVDSTDGRPAASEAERMLAASARDLDELSTRLGAR